MGGGGHRHDSQFTCKWCGDKKKKMKNELKKEIYCFCTSLAFIRMCLLRIYVACLNISSPVWSMNLKYITCGSIEWWLLGSLKHSSSVWGSGIGFVFNVIFTAAPACFCTSFLMPAINSALSVRITCLVNETISLAWDIHFVLLPL